MGRRTRLSGSTSREEVVIHAKSAKMKPMLASILSKIHILHFTFRVVATQYLHSRIIKRNKIMIEETKGYTLSVDTYKKAKALKMKDPRYYIYASLRGSGMPMRDCWAIAFQGEGLNWEKSFLENEMNLLEAQESVQKRIAEVQGKKVKNENSEELTAEELAKATSKEQILKDLVLAQRKAKYGSPEWLKIVASIADYNKIKQDEIDTENNVVHYYIPLSMPRCCEDCIIFKNGQATFQKKKK
nr:MAG TPA: hypothetical protein [Caudoviricetes sp.]